MESRSLSPVQSRPLVQKVKEYRIDLNKLRNDVRRATAPTDAAARAELGLGDDFYQNSASQRERLLSATDKINKTSDRIHQGRQQLLETEVSSE